MICSMSLVEGTCFHTVYFAEHCRGYSALLKAGHFLFLDRSLDRQIWIDKWRDGWLADQGGGDIYMYGSSS